MKKQTKQKIERENTFSSGRFIFFAGLLCMMLCSTVLGGSVSYDLERDNVSMGYDEGNRMVLKRDFVFVYDGGMEDSLTNVSDGVVLHEYEYDERRRVVKEIKSIDGISFERVVEYDSQDRKVSSEVVEKVEYLYGNDGKLKLILDMINLSYNENLQVLERICSSGLVSSLDYDSENFRVTEIVTNDSQDLGYSYDLVGNVLGISDGVGGANFSMEYDGLNRLVNSIISRIGVSDELYYDYNPIGNMMRVSHNNVTLNYTYGSLAHAPSDVSSIQDGPTLQVMDRVEFYAGDEVVIGYSTFDWRDREVEVSINDSRFSQDGDSFAWQSSVSDNGTFIVELTANNGAFNTTKEITVYIAEPPVISISSPSAGEIFYNLSELINIRWVHSFVINNGFIRYNIEYFDNSNSSWINLVEDLGFVNSWNDSKQDHLFNFSAGPGNETVYLRLPKNITVSNVKINLTEVGV